MTTYPSHFSQSLGNAGSMAYLKASPTYHLNGLSALGMSHGLDSLQSQSIHYGGGKYGCSVIQYGILIAIVLNIELIS